MRIAARVRSRLYKPVTDFATTVVVPSWPVVTVFTMPMPLTHHSVDFQVDGGIAGNFIPGGSFAPGGGPENSDVEVRVNSTLINDKSGSPGPPANHAE